MLDADHIRVTAVLEIFVGIACALGLGVILAWYLLHYPTALTFTMGLALGLSYAISSRTRAHWRVAVDRLRRVRVTWR